MLHDRFAGPVRASDIAREVGVHPAHLARGFRQHFHTSVGSYVRRLRLDWFIDKQSTDLLDCRVQEFTTVAEEPVYRVTLLGCTVGGGLRRRFRG